MPHVRETDERLSATGVKLFGRTLFNREDYNVDLQGSKGTAIYEKMRLSDPEIASSLLRVTMPLVSANWAFEPAKDVAGGEDHAELCERCIMGGAVFGHSQRDTWRQFLEHALLMLPFGFSMFEKIWGVADDGRQVYSRVVPILPKTIDEFHFDEDGDLVGALQRAYHAMGGWKTVELPVEKLVVISFAREGDNYWGRSVLRAAYQPWFHKRELVILDGIRHERHGVGFMWIKLPDGASPAQREDAEEVAREARAHERQGIVTEGEVEVSIIYPTGTASPLIESIKYYDSQISQTMIAEWMHLGASESGSRAVAQSKIDFALMAYQGTAKVIEEAVNQQLVVPLIDRNFGPQEAYPTLQVQDLDKMSGDQLALVLAPLVEKGVIRVDRVLEEHVRELLDLPEIDDETREEKMDPLSFLKGAGGVVGGGAASSEDGNGAAAGGVEADMMKAAVAKRVAAEFRRSVLDAKLPRVFHREPKPHEAACDFSDIADFLDEEPRRIWHRIVAPFRSQQIRRVASIASKLSDAELAKGKFDAPLKSRLAEELARPLLSAYMKGRRTVLEERRRQLAGVGVGTVTMAEGDEEDEEFEEEPTAAQKKWIGTLALAIASGMSLGLVRRAIEVSMQGRQAELSAREIERRVDEQLRALSTEVLVAELSGQVTRAFTTGRNEQADAMKEEIETAFYSAIMDENTCLAPTERVFTEIGWIPVASVSPGMKVLSGSGRMRRVRFVSVWKAESLVVIRGTDGHALRVTLDHPVLAMRNGEWFWFEAGSLRVGDAVLSSKPVHSRLEISDDVAFSNPREFESGALGCSRFSDVSGFGIGFRMPVGAVEFDEKIGGGNVEIEDPSSDLVFPGMFYSSAAKSASEGKFDAARPCSSAIASKGAETRITAGGSSFDRPAHSAFEDMDRPAAEFGTMSSIDGAGASESLFTARALLPYLCGAFASDRTVDVSVGIASGDIEGFKASGASLRSSIHSARFGTVGVDSAGGSKSFAACLAVSPGEASGITVPAEDGGAMAASFGVISDASAAISTGIRHDLMLPRTEIRLWTKEIISSVSIESYWGDVYDVGLEEEHTFFAEGMLVHNCEVCEALDGAEHEYGDETYQTPNPECFGRLGNNECRCVTVPVFKREKVAA